MLHGAVKRLAMKLSKICNDLRLLSSGPRTALKRSTCRKCRLAPPSCRPRSTRSFPSGQPVLLQGIRQRRHHHLRRRGRSAAAERHGASDWSGHVRIQLILMEKPASPCARSAWKASPNPDICMNHVLNSIGIVTYLNPHHSVTMKATSSARSVPKPAERPRSRAGTQPADRRTAGRDPLHREPDEPAIQNGVTPARSHHINEQMGQGGSAHLKSIPERSPHSPIGNWLFNLIKPKNWKMECSL